MLRAESSWSQIQAATGCSRATVAKIAKRIDVVKGSADRALVTSGFVALPVQSPIPADDPRFQVLFGEALYECALEFRNCLKDHLARPALGNTLFYRWAGAKPAVLELEAHCEGHWVLGDLLGPRNTLVDAETKAAIRAALREHGVLYGVHPVMPRAAAVGLSHLLQLWTAQWDVTTDTQDESYVVSGLEVMVDQEGA